MITQTSLRINTKTYKKLEKISEMNKRSLNKQINYIIEEEIKKFEKENGEININIKSTEK